MIKTYALFIILMFASLMAVGFGTSLHYVSDSGFNGFNFIASTSIILWGFFVCIIVFGFQKMEKQLEVKK